MSSFELEPQNVFITSLTICGVVLSYIEHYRMPFSQEWKNNCQDKKDYIGQKL